MIAFECVMSEGRNCWLTHITVSGTVQKVIKEVLLLSLSVSLWSYSRLQPVTTVFCNCSITLESCIGTHVKRYNFPVIVL